MKSTAKSTFTPPALLHRHAVQIGQGILHCPAMQVISHTGSRLLQCLQSPRAGCFFSPFVLSFYPLGANPDRRNKQGARFVCAGLGWSYLSVAYFGSWWHSSIKNCVYKFRTFCYECSPMVWISMHPHLAQYNKFMLIVTRLQKLL